MKVLVMIITFMFSRFGGFPVFSCLVFSCTVLMYPNLFLVGLLLFSCISTTMVKPPGLCGHHHCASHGHFLSLSFNSTLWRNSLTKKQLIEVSTFQSYSQHWRLCSTGNSGMCTRFKLKVLTHVVISRTWLKSVCSPYSNSVNSRMLLAAFHWFCKIENGLGSTNDRICSELHFSIWKRNVDHFILCFITCNSKFFTKVGCVFPMVIWPEFRLGLYRDENYRKTHSTLPFPAFGMKSKFLFIGYFTDTIRKYFWQDSISSWYSYPTDLLFLWSHRNQICYCFSIKCKYLLIGWNRNFESLIDSKTHMFRWRMILTFSTYSKQNSPIIKISTPSFILVQKNLTF